MRTYIGKYSTPFPFMRQGISADAMWGNHQKSMRKEDVTKTPARTVKGYGNIFEEGVKLRRKNCVRGFNFDISRERRKIGITLWNLWEGDCLSDNFYH
jgi:hypothetical protein